MMETIGKQIKDQRVKQGKTVYRVAKDSKIRIETVQAIEADGNVGLAFINKVLTSLGANNVTIKWDLDT